MSFGFSADDFVASILLIKDVTQALDSSTGSVSEVKSLVEQLETLKQAIINSEFVYQQTKIIEVGLESRLVMETLTAGIRAEHQKCKTVLETYNNSLKPYTDAFVKDRGLNLMQHASKIAWLFRKDDAAKLERNIGSHFQALTMYTRALSEIHASSSARCSVDILSNLIHLKVEVTKISNTLHPTTEFRIPKSLGYTWEANFEPADNVLLLDAIGRTVFLPTILLSSPKDLHSILMMMYRDIHGRKKIMRKEYTITDENSDGMLLDESNWNMSVQGGMQLSSIWYSRYRNPWMISAAHDVMKIRWVSHYLGNENAGCHKCQLTFRIFNKERILEVDDAKDSSEQEGDKEPSTSHANSQEPVSTMKPGSIKIQQILKYPLSEDFLFRNVHYHREIRRLKHQPTKKTEINTEKDFDIEELPILHRAAAKGNLSDIDTIVNDGKDIDYPLPYNLVIKRGRLAPSRFLGCSPLHMACWHGQIKTINHLLDMKANVKARDSRGAEAFHYAVHSPNPERTFRVLLKRGANPNAKDNHGVQALHSACQYGLGWSIQFFLDYGADIRDTTATGLTPLHYCVWGNCQSVFDILVDEGIEMDNGANDQIWFPIHFAAYSGSLSIAKSLLELGCSLDVSDKDGRTPLYLACQEGHLALVELLLSRGADVKAGNSFGGTPIHLAAWIGNVPLVQMLLDHNAELIAEDYNGGTTLRLAILNSHEAVVETLLQHNASILEPQDGLLHLHCASFCGNIRIVKMLLDKGADVNAVDSSGLSSLELASGTGHYEIVALLLENGAVINYQDAKGVTALHLASSLGHEIVVKHLLSRGASCLADKKGQTPLHHAAYHGSEANFKLLLEAGASPNAKIQDGKITLHWAAIKGHIGVVRLLIEAGVDVCSQDNTGQTALHYACDGGHENIIQLLLAKGCNPSVTDINNKTALEIAEQRGHSTIVELLRNVRSEGISMSSQT